MNPSNYVDITGLTFGILTVIKRAPRRNTHEQAYWECSCSCGGLAVTTGTRLKSGHTKSCGCLRKDTTTPRSKRTVQHGGSGTSEFKSWDGMRQRCSNPNDANFARYGGRGIRICERWESFEAFLSDMGTKPSPKMSIDRINNDGNYEPSNCRWATSEEQARNRRSNKLLSFDGKTMVLREWASVYGIAHQTLNWRIGKGWEVGRALTTRPRWNPHCAQETRKPAIG